MRTTIRTIAAMSAAILALVSCSKENLIGNGKKNNDGVRVISLSFAQSTKTVLGENGITPKFVAGDVIKLSDGSKTEECTVEENEGVATITTTLSGKLTAIYPASAANGQCDGIVNPLNQDGTFKNANICMATIEDGAEKAVFHNKTAILRFYVDNSIGVKSITVKQGVVAGDSITITIKPAAELFDTTNAVGPDKRLCYVSVAGAPAANTLRFISETTTQGTVSRTPTSTATLEDGGMYNAFIPYYIAVDLGEKGVQKWGYCNVGAFLPEEAGEYFSWGEVVGHKWVDGKWTNFPTVNPDPSRYTGSWDAEGGFQYTNAPYVITKSPTVTKPTSDPIEYNKYKEDDDKVVLEPCDDAARVNWGGSWRMPTSEELTALAALDSNSSGWDNTDGHKGWIVPGTNSKLFFPAGGNSSTSNLNNVGVKGSYWRSSLYTDNPEYAYALHCDDGNVLSEYFTRPTGRSVRAISN